MRQKLFNRWPVAWIAVKADFHNLYCRRIGIRREFNCIAFVNDRVDFLNRIAKFAKRRTSVNETVEYTPEGPNVCFPANLKKSENLIFDSQNLRIETHKLPYILD